VTWRRLGYGTQCQKEDVVVQPQLPELGESSTTDLPMILEVQPKPQATENARR
jgi:hypothetical protein